MASWTRVHPGMRFLLVVASLAFGPAWALESGEVAPTVPGAPRGVVLYVDFWASWCVPCRQSLPALDALYRKHGPAGFAVVGVNKDVRAEDAKRFIQRVPVSFTWVADEGDALARGFGVKAMPSGYLVDRKGVIRQVHRGFTPETDVELEKQVRDLLAESQ